MLFTLDNFIYRAVRSTLIKLVVIMTNYPVFESFYYDVAMFVAYIVCFVVKLAFNFICSWFVTSYFASSYFSVTYQFYGYIHDFYIFNMSDDINTRRVVIGLFVNATQQPAVFHLNKYRDSTLYSMLLFLLLLIVFKEFSNNRDLILGTFFSLWSNGFFIEKKLAIKNRHDFCVSSYSFSFISLEISFAFKLLLILCGDVELNQGPDHWSSLFFCHWNLNSIFAHDFV